MILTRTRKRQWFPIRLDETDPLVIQRIETRRPDNGLLETFEPHRIAGKFVRVFPAAERPWEIFFVQMLEHRRQKFAPAHGDGVLILEELLPAVVDV